MDNIAEPPLVIEAPAKLNLRLEIVGQRGDGYHLLDTDMVPVSVFDRIRILPRADGVVTCRCSDPAIKGESDLCARAAQLLKSCTRSSAGADISTEKGIPVGTGMGGGSSDAAAVLLGLNRLWDLGLDVSELEAFALKLGSDVPFFLHCRPMRVRGMGERLEPLECEPQKFLIVVPEWRMSTEMVYRRLDDLLESATINGTDSLPDRMGRNDLLPAVLNLSPPAFRLMAEKMLDLFGNACLTGSGSAVYSVLEEGSGEIAAEAAFRRNFAGFRWLAAETVVPERRIHVGE